MTKDQRNASEVAMATSEDRIQGVNYRTQDTASTNNQSKNNSTSTDFKSSSEDASNSDTTGPSTEQQHKEQMATNGHHNGTDKTREVNEPKKTK